MDIDFFSLEIENIYIVRVLLSIEYSELSHHYSYDEIDGQR